MLYNSRLRCCVSSLAARRKMAVEGRKVVIGSWKVEDDVG